jgi:hypothetical protein
MLVERVFLPPGRSDNVKAREALPGRSDNVKAREALPRAASR